MDYLSLTEGESMSRTRVFENGSYPVSYPQTYTVNGVTQSWVAPVTITSTRYKYMVDEVVPNFAKRRAAGEVFCNSMLMVRGEVNHVPTRIHNYGVETGTSNPRTDIGSLIFPITGQSLPSLERIAIENYLADYSNSRDIAVTAAWANVDESEINALASAGELRETLSWVESILRRAIALINMVRRKTLLKKAKKALKGDLVGVVSDFWLELRYALRPLVYEMDSAMKALNKHIEAGTRRTARGYAGSRSPATDTTTVTESKDYGYWGVNYSVTTAVTRSYRAGVLYAINDSLPSMADVWGLNQPIEALYELMPFSFILDWFFNVGDVLSSIFISANLSPLTSWVTEEHLIVSEKVATSIVIWNTRSTYNRDLSIEQPGYHQALVHIKRRIPSPYRSYLPSIRIKLDPSKIFDIAAIGRNLLNSLARR